MDNPTVSTVFATLGAVCWSVQLAPQIFLNWRRKSASGLSVTFMLLWAGAGIPLGVYNIVSGFSIALQIQPQILTALSLATWGQCCFYERKWSLSRSLTRSILIALSLGALEAGLVFALRHGIDDGVQWPVTLMAVLAAAMLALGVLEQYIAIWKTRSVEGISFLFCAIDALGDLTSIISVLYSSELDVLGLVIYGVELGLWMGIFACGFALQVWPSISRKLKSRHQVDAVPEGLGTPGQSVMLHDLSSSSSVFRTASVHNRQR